jgi:hypothetical protein
MVKRIYILAITRKITHRNTTTFQPSASYRVLLNSEHGDGGELMLEGAQEERDVFAGGNVGG